MKKLQILRVDNDSVQKVDLQIGENLIGRSVSSNSDDDRIIKHAVTINVKNENEITLTPYQVTPCYVKFIDSLRWQFVKLGTTVPLRPGDICSLLPDKCWFKVLTVAEKTQSSEENASKRKVDEETESMSAKRFCVDSGEGDNLHSTSCHTLYKMKDNDDAVKTNEENQLSDETEDQMLETNGNSMCIAKATEMQSSTMKDADLTSENGMKSPRAGETSSHACQNNEDPQSSVQEAQQPEALSSTTSTANVRREKCKYGKDCYRKNPRHKAEFSHVGDPDYNEPDDREECPYGTRCYRKNPDHRQRFKHTFTNKRNKRKQPRVQPSSNFTDVEDYSGEESVDESVDESDYEPSTDIDSEYEQDDLSDSE